MMEMGVLNMKERTITLGMLALLSLTLAAPTAASQRGTGSGTRANVGQAAATVADIQRLEDALRQMSSDVSRLRTTDQNLAAQLDSDLIELTDEVTYLTVRMRREGRVPTAHYTDVRDRIQDLRTRTRADRYDTRGERNDTRGDRNDARRTEGTGTYRPGTSQSAIPSGQEIDVRLQTQISSSTAQVEDRFEATTVVDLYRGNDVLIPAGSVMRGIIRTVDRATRTDRKGELTVSFDQVTINGRSYPMRGTVTDAIESEGVRSETKRIGTGSAIGGIIGGILGGVKGALMGILIGGGGTIAATPGKDVTLDPGTILRVRLDTPPDLR